MGFSPAWVDVILANGSRGGHATILETLSIQSSPGVALCGPTMYSSMPWLPDFIEHYERLGVDEFHFYLPEGAVVESFLVNPSHADGVFSTETGSLSIEKAKYFEHHAVHWHNFTASPGSASFNLRAGNNDCISRLKYSHKYAVIADMDEFLHIGNIAGVTKISDLMEKYLPDSAAALSLADVHYPRDCRCHGL